MVRVRLLGPVDVAAGGVIRPVRGLRRKAVLSVLALHRGQIVSADRLIDVVWGDSAAAVAVNTLQSHVSHLRGVLGDRDAILARPPGYLLGLDAGAVDVEAAEELIDRAEHTADAAERARHSEAALGLWRGSPLLDVTGLPWLEEQARRLDGLRLRATHAWIDAGLALGRHLPLLPELERLAGEHPLDERLQAQLIVALYRADRQAAALSAYQRLRRTLGEELGITPNRSLRELEVAILRQDPGLQGPPAPVETRSAAAIGPGPGIAAASGRPVAAEVQLDGTAVIGRGTELRVLGAAVDAAGRGAGGAVFVVGEPGIGKTNLAAGTARLAESRGLTVLRGRAAGPAMQFRPLSEALQSVLRHSGPPGDAELLAYRPALSRLVPQWRGERPGLEEPLVVLAEAVLRLVVTLGRPRGCVLILEDLHDADADTLAVIDYLIDNAGRERLLIVGTARTDPGPALQLVRAAEQRRAARVVELRRLGDDAVRALAGACLGVGGDAVPVPVLELLLATADGVPLHIEELLAALVSDRVLARTAGAWAVTGPAVARVPVSLGTTLAGRAERLGPAAAALLRAAALLGRRFPAAVAGAAAGLDPATLLACLREAVDAQLLTPQDDQQWYAFRHVLTAEALRERLLPLERAVVARRAAEAIGAAPFDGVEQLTGELWSLAGEPARAAERFGAAGRLAAAQGAFSTAVSLLERALGLAGAELAADLGETLVGVYAGAGRITDAYALGSRAAPGRRATIHLHLARVAAAAGDWAQGLREVRLVRRLLSPPDRTTGARLDAIEAELVFGDPTAADRQRVAWRLAERALAAARETGQPDVECSALETMGRCARLRDLAEAGALYERGLAVAQAAELVGWKLNLLYHLGTDHGIREAGTARLGEALEVANQAGAVVTALNIELELGIVRLCRGEFEAAEAGARHCEQTAARLRLTHTRLLAAGQQVMIAAHRGRLTEAQVLLARFQELGGEQDDYATAVHGFGLAFAHLLDEDPAAALSELSAAWSREARHPASYLSFIHGPHLLLSVVAGRAGTAECAALAASAQAQARWNRQFLVLAQALLHGRAGRRAEAGESLALFVTLAEPYPVARHLALRLAAPQALAHGWGEPAVWLRAAEAYFHDTSPRVARACRELLRRAGAAVPQHRRGSAQLPPRVRERGITVRESEVLSLVAEQLSTREIGRRLVLSPRTVEKHVAHLLAKTGAPDRDGLAAFAAEVLNVGSP